MRLTLQRDHGGRRARDEASWRAWRSARADLACAISLPRQLASRRRRRSRRAAQARVRRDGHHRRRALRQQAASSSNTAFRRAWPARPGSGAVGHEDGPRRYSGTLAGDRFISLRRLRGRRRRGLPVGHPGVGLRDRCARAAPAGWRHHDANDSVVCGQPPPHLSHSSAVMNGATDAAAAAPFHYADQRAARGRAAPACRPAICTLAISVYQSQYSSPDEL